MFSLMVLPDDETTSSSKNAAAAWLESLLPDVSGLDAFRARLVLIAASIITAAMLLFLLVQGAPFVFRGIYHAAPAADYVIDAIGLAIGVSAILLNRSGRIQAATWLVIGSLIALAALQLYLEGSPPIDLAGAFSLLVVVVLAVVLLDSPGTWLAIAAAIVIYEGAHLLWRAGMIQPAIGRTLPARSIFAMVAWLVCIVIIAALMQSTLGYLRFQSRKLEKQTHDLGERIKEIRCLYHVTDLLRHQVHGMDDSLQQVVEVLPPGWQYPDITCARIRFLDKEYVTDNFKETTWRQIEDLVIADDVAGSVEVFYLEERPEEAEGPFLKEERDLLKAIADQIAAEVIRWQAREALEDSETRYRILIENVPLAIGLATLDGQVRAWNEAAYALTGYPHDTPLADINMAEIYHNPEDRSRAIARLQADGYLRDFETKINRRDGTVRDASLSFVPCMLGGEQLLLSVGQDVSRRKQAEEALRASEERYRHTLDNMLEGCQIIGDDWRYLYLNDAVTRQGHRDKEELLGRTMMEAYPGIEETAMFSVLRRCMDERVSERMVNEFVYPDGSSAWFELGIQPVPEGLFILSYDITARKQAAEALRDSEERYRILVENVPLGIGLATPDGQLKAWNKAAYELFGISPDTPPEDIDLSGVYHNPEDRVRAKARFREDGYLRKFEFKANRSDGAVRDVTLSFTPCMLGSEQFVLSVLQDITERKQAEEEIRSLARFPGENPGPVMRVASDGTLLYSNKPGLSLLSDGQLQIGQIVPPILGDVVSQALVSGAMQLLDLELGERVYSLHVVPISEAGYANLYGRDITERKRAEEALRDSEEHFRAIFERSTIGKSITTPTGQLLKINQSFADMLGYTVEEMQKLNFAELTHPDDTAESQECVRCLLANEQSSYQMEKRYLHKKGQTIWTIVTTMLLRDQFGDPRYFITSIVNITQRKQAEEKVRRQKQELTAALQQKDEAYILLDTLMSTAPVGLAFVDSELCYRRINDTLAEVNGVPAKDHIGYAVREVLPELAPVVEPLFRRVMETRQPIVNLDVSGETPKSPGEHRDWLASYYPVVAQDGSVLGVGLVVLEITERKRMEEQVRKLNEGLEQQVLERTAELQEANRELEAFSYSISHDLRAPLRAMDGFSRILVEEYADMLPPDGARYLHRVRANAQQMARLIDELLTFSRLSRQELNKQSVAPADLARQAFANLRAIQEEREVQITIGDLPVCQADPVLLRQVFANLLDNALKFTRDQKHPSIEVGYTQVANEDVVYYVKDNGVGFDMRYVDKLFGVFQRLHRVEEYEGTGVGLATVKRIIHRHGGRIWVEAAVGLGATFYFTLGGNNNE